MDDWGVPHFRKPPYGNIWSRPGWTFYQRLQEASELCFIVIVTNDTNGI
jgi:hypothetical protein